MEMDLTDVRDRLQAIAERSHNTPVVVKIPQVEENVQNYLNIFKDYISKNLDKIINDEIRRIMACAKSISNKDYDEQETIDEIQEGLFHIKYSVCDVLNDAYDKSIGYVPSEYNVENIECKDNLTRIEVD